MHKLNRKNKEKEMKEGRKEDKQQGPNVQHRVLYSISCDKP